MKIMENKFKLTESQIKFIGLIGILCVVLFTYSVVNIVSSNSKKEIEKLEEINRNAELREKNAIKQRDSAKYLSIEMALKVSNLEGQAKKQNEILSRFQQSYDKNIIELKQFKNEKNFIPTNVSIDDQTKFLSNYKYQQY